MKNAPSAQTAAALMDEYIRSYAEAGTFMGSVLVARRGVVLLSKGYGMANLAGRAANGPRTRFRLGSISKGFTAVAILQLQEQGKLSIEDPLSRFIPGFPGSEGIRIRHLLSHTSGGDTEDGRGPGRDSLRRAMESAGGLDRR